MQMQPEGQPQANAEHIMGTFVGHIGPGAVFFIAGIMQYLLALNNSRISQCLRRPSVYVSLLLFLSIGSFIGLAIERIQDEREFPWYTRPHLFMYGFTGAACILNLLHLLNILREPMWCMPLPLGVAIFGIQFYTHDDSNYLSDYLHKVTTYLLLLVAFLKSAEFIAAMSLPYTWPSTTTSTDSSSSCTKFFCCKMSLSDMNLAYVNPRIYDTILPSLSGFMTIVLGVLWLFTGFYIYIYKMYTLNAARSTGLTFSLLVLSVSISYGVCGVISLLEYFPSSFCCKRQTPVLSDSAVEFEQLNPSNNGSDNLIVHDVSEQE